MVPVDETDVVAADRVGLVGDQDDAGGGVGVGDGGGGLDGRGVFEYAGHVGEVVVFIFDDVGLGRVSAEGLCLGSREPDFLFGPARGDGEAEREQKNDDKYFFHR